MGWILMAFGCMWQRHPGCRGRSWTTQRGHMALKTTIMAARCFHLTHGGWAVDSNNSTIRIVWACHLHYAWHYACHAQTWFLLHTMCIKCTMLIKCTWHMPFLLVFTQLVLKKLNNRCRCTFFGIWIHDQMLVAHFYWNKLKSILQIVPMFWHEMFIKCYSNLEKICMRLHFRSQSMSFKVSSGVLELIYM